MTTVMAVFVDASSACDAVRALERTGFETGDITIGEWHAPVSQPAAVDLRNGTLVGAAVGAAIGWAITVSLLLAAGFAADKTVFAGFVMGAVGGAALGALYGATGGAAVNMDARRADRRTGETALLVEVRTPDLDAESAALSVFEALHPHRIEVD